MIKEHSEIRTILVVDDYTDTREMVQRFLEAKGYRAIAGTNGQEALEIAIRERPDLILMDLSMPVLDGFTATRLIREIEDLDDVPIVAITAYGTFGQEFHHHFEGRGVGISECLSKPINFAELETLLSKLLSEKKTKAKSQA